MEKTGFIDLINHYAGTQPEEANAIRNLRNNYPYSQVIQVLAARFAKDHAWSDQQGLLQSAAVYSTDRSVLKEVMTTTYAKSVRLAKDRPAIKQEVAPNVETSTIDFAAEVLRDLERLQKTKSDFEHMLSDIESNLPVLNRGKEDVIQEVEEGPEKKPATKKTAAKNTAANDEETADKPKAKRGPGRPRKKEPSDPLIEEIKTTKKKVTPSKQKAKEQIEIIDQFIKSQPKITPIESSNQNIVTEGDSDAAAEGDFGDNVISETLVEILKKQGKKDKAVEVLRKLIWKYPQKKAYFAAQIEELTK